jgi:hypothetical protein
MFSHFLDIDDEYLKQRYFQIIKESPLVVGKSFSNELDYRDLNIAKASEIIKNYSFKDEFNLKANLVFRLYEVDFLEYKQFLFISPEPEIRCYFIVKEVDGGLYNDGVWQKRDHYGLARNIVFNYILQKWDFFASSNTQYKQGFNFWKKLLDEAVASNKKITVLNRETGKEQTYNHSCFSDYSGNDKEKQKYIFKIYK